MTEWIQNGSHWGAFRARRDDDGHLLVRPHEFDPHPSALLDNLPSMLDRDVRVPAPLVRESWLRRRDRQGRGSDQYVEVSWDEATRLVADELGRIVEEHGNEAIFGGSYGWSSAGRFHHAQSQVHRFLNAIGGYTASLNNYSTGASMVLLPYLVGPDQGVRRMTSWEVIAEHTDLLVCFGGIPTKNFAVIPGGTSAHDAPRHFARMAQRGVRCVLLGPQRTDAPAGLDTTWIPTAPGSDLAVLLALCHELISHGRYDREFVERHTVGFDRVRDHVLGADDGIEKSVEWAGGLTGIEPRRLRELAESLTTGRTLITIAYSLQRVPLGEHTIMASLVLAALTGQIGLPGGGWAHGLGSIGDMGFPDARHPLPTLDQLTNPVGRAIPCAMISDLLLREQDGYDYDGAWHEYPRIKAVHWAGGNPFHHHQNLSRLRRALREPDIVIVQEPFWTTMARHADIVLPATTTVERADIGASRADSRLLAMYRVTEPLLGSRNDFDILSDIADRMGAGHTFHEGRSEMDWVEHLYETWRARMSAEWNWETPPFAEFWKRGHLDLPGRTPNNYLADFRESPDRAPLRTPSKRLELHSEKIASFGYEDSPGHPRWVAAPESPHSDRARDFPFVLISNQPSTRLHSQLAHGSHSRNGTSEGRERVRICPADATRHGVAEDDVVELSNERGAILVTARLDADIMEGVLEVPTGAWFDPDERPDGTLRCRAGNPNVLTSDEGTSVLTRGCSGGRALVRLRRCDPHEVPPVRTYRSLREQGVFAPGPAKSQTAKGTRA